MGINCLRILFCKQGEKFDKTYLVLNKKSLLQRSASDDNLITLDIQSIQYTPDWYVCDFHDKNVLTNLRYAAQELDSDYDGLQPPTTDLADTWGILIQI